MMMFADKICMSADHSFPYTLQPASHMLEAEEGG